MDGHLEKIEGMNKQLEMYSESFRRSAEAINGLQRGTLVGTAQVALKFHPEGKVELSEAKGNGHAEVHTLSEHETSQLRMSKSSRPEGADTEGV